MCSIYPSLAEAYTPPGFCAYTLPAEIDQARSVLSLTPTSFLALERGSNSVVRFNENGNTFSKTVLASQDRMNHGIAYYDGYLYASSDTDVYRWALADPVNGASTGSTENVIDNISADGSGGAPFGHTTRTLVFDKQGRLYVSVGSAGNVDDDSFRSRIRRFSLNDTSAFPIDFTTGEVFADGLRNEVGMAFDKHDVLWGVQNGADTLRRRDLGGDIHNDNPADELNQYKEEDAGKHWGYPYCWTEFCLDEEVGLGKGAVWAWPSFMRKNHGDITDEYCRNNFLPSNLALQAHGSPLGIAFYNYVAPENRPSECDPNVAFPPEMDGYAIIPMHGSWNRDEPVGYRVTYVAMDSEGNVASDVRDLLAHEGDSAKWDDGNRPVDVSFDDCGRLLVTSDGTRKGIIFSKYTGSKVMRVEYDSSVTFEHGPFYPPEGTACAPPSRRFLFFGIVLGIIALAVQLIALLSFVIIF